MIKGITSVAPIASEDAFEKLGSLFRSLGFEPGKGWTVDGAQGAPFLAPVGNLELVTGRAPAVPPMLIETTQLDTVYASVRRGWRRTSARKRLSFAADRTGGRRTGTRGCLRSSSLRAEASVSGSRRTHCMVSLLPIEGDLSAAGMRFAIVMARWNAVITDRLLQGALDGLYRSGAAKAMLRLCVCRARGRFLGGAHAGGVEAV